VAFANLAGIWQHTEADFRVFLGACMSSDVLNIGSVLTSQVLSIGTKFSPLKSLDTVL